MKRFFKSLLMRPLIWYRDRRVVRVHREGGQWWTDDETARRQRLVNWSNPNWDDDWDGT